MRALTIGFFDSSCFPGLVTLVDPQHDSVVRENVYDIQQLGARVYANQLYVVVSFYGLSPTSHALQHQFWINTCTQRVWFGCYESTAACNTMVQTGGRWSKAQKAAGTHFKRGRDVEFLVPLATLGAASKLNLSYTVMSGPKAHAVRTSDGVRGLNLSLPSQRAEIRARTVPVTPAEPRR